MLYRFIALLAFAASAEAFVATPARITAPRAQMPRVAQTSMSAAADDFVPDMQRRTIMNLVLLGGAGVPVLWMLGGFVYFFVPPGGGGGGGGLTAKDANGDDVLVQSWIKANPYPGRSLVQGLKGDAHYLIVKQDGTLEN